MTVAEAITNEPCAPTDVDAKITVTQSTVYFHNIIRKDHLNMTNDSISQVNDSNISNNHSLQPRYSEELEFEADWLQKQITPGAKGSKTFSLRDASNCSKPTQRVSYANVCICVNTMLYSKYLTL